MSRLSPLPALAVLLVSPVASALYEDDAGALNVGASLRTTSVAAQYYDSPLFTEADGSQNRADALGQSEFRLTFDGYPAPWFGYELHLAQDLWSATSTFTGLGFAGTGVQPLQYRIADAARTWVDERDVTATLVLDRANLRYRFPFLQLTLGRQAVSFGKARFWNPLDAFLPFDARQFDREYKPGVDAARASVPLGDLSGLELVGVLGRDVGDPSFLSSWRGSALLGRAYTNVADWDLSVQGGKIYGGYQLGGGLTGTLGPIELRAEGAYFIPMPGDPIDDHLVAVVGVGKVFDSSLNLQAEYLYSGAGAHDRDGLASALVRVETGRALQMSQQVLGVLASYDLFPLLTGSLASLVSVSDGSAMLLPQFDYSVSDESSLTLGAMLAAGRRPRASGGPQLDLRSEFGTYPNFYFLQYRLYF